MSVLAATTDGRRARFQAVADAAAKDRRTLRQRLAAGEVEWSPDLQRILELPRRSKPELLPVMAALTQALKRPEGTMELRELQAWCLDEFPREGGGIAGIQAGAGKTLLGMLMPMVWAPIRENGTFRPVRAVLFIRSDLRAQFEKDWEFYGKHWRLPNLAGSRWFDKGLPNLHVVAYSELQSPKKSNLMEELRPDLVLADEVSALRNFDTARVRRLRRFFAMFPTTAFCGWDATLTSDSVEDMWHFLAWALDVRSPMPLDEAQVRKWGRALDPKPVDAEETFLPGQLMRLCQPGEDARTGFQRRLVETSGVVASDDNMLNLPLTFRERPAPAMPDELVHHLKVLRRRPTDGGWLRPDGEVLTEALEVVNCARDLATGFYMRWRYPRGEPVELIEDWFSKRQAWNRELRARLLSPIVHMDSDRLCENAAARWYDGGCPGCGRGPQEAHELRCRAQTDHPLWPAYTFPAWREIKHKVKHVSETVWVSSFLVDDAAKWALEEPGIVWVEHPQFGHALSRKAGIPYYGAGDEASETIISETGGRSIICSVGSNTRGKNLQMFYRNLITSFPASNDVLEQAVSRTYRSGQTKPVVVDYYMHTKELENAFEKAVSRAEFVQATMGTAQKLVYAHYEKRAA